MPKKGYLQTKEHRMKLSDAKVGKASWNKGLKNWMSEDGKQRMIASKKGKPGWNKGKTLSDEHKKKLSEAKVGKVGPWKGKKRPELSGEKHPRWKGGSENRKQWLKNRRAKEKNATGSHTFGDWEILKAQYNWTCPCCLKKEPEIKLTEDHIVPLSKGGSNNIQNIQPLCHRCNSKKHAKIIAKFPIPA